MIAALLFLYYPQTIFASSEFKFISDFVQLYNITVTIMHQF